MSLKPRSTADSHKQGILGALGVLVANLLLDYKTVNLTLLPVGHKLFNTDVGQWVFGQLLHDAVRDGADVGTNQSGVEYVQSREYMPGDPIKSIDWRVTARTRKIFVKEYETPKRLPCYLMLDTSASMTISSAKRSKYAEAVFIAGGIALACLDRVSPVGIVGVGDNGLRVDPSLSKQQVLEWLLRLRRYRFDEPTTLGQRLRELAPSLKTRALLIILSDMHDPTALAALKRISQVHDCAVLQMRDPAEVNMRGSGFMRAQEAETGHAYVTHGRQSWIDHDVMAQELRRKGIDHLVIPTDQSYVHRLRYFFSARDLLGRGAR